MGDFTAHPFAPPSFHQDNENWGKVKPNWFPDDDALNCFSCNATFNTFKRRHHCRLCGGVFCGNCCNSKAIISTLYDGAQRVCTQCFLRIRERNTTNHNNFSNIDKRISRSQINISQDNIQVYDEKRKCYINELPEHLIIKIFLYLGEKDIFSLPLVCRTFHRIMDLNFLWRDLYCSKWNVQRGATQHIGINWKLVYKEKHIKEKENRMIHEAEREERSHSHSDPNLLKKSQPRIVKPLPLRSCLTKEGAKIVLLGAEGVGKSTLVSYLCTEKFIPDHSSTIGANYASKSIMVGESLVKLCIWDTSGVEKYWTLAPMYYMDAHVALLVYDITLSESFEVVKKWMRELRAMGPPNLFVCLVGNKSDLSHQRRIDHSVISNFIQEEDIMMAIETSSRNGDNIAKLFEEIAKSLSLSINLNN